MARLVVNPTYEELERSQLNVVVAGTRAALVMVEGGGQEVSEALMLEALEAAQQALQPCIDLQCELQRLAGKPKMVLPPVVVDTALRQQVWDLVRERLPQVLRIPEKLARQDAMAALEQEVLAAVVPAELPAAEAAQRTKAAKAFFHEFERQEMRRQILEEGRRADGRGPADIRPISGRVSLLPRPHGSALFTRGETQALVVVTLGTKSDEQLVDDLEGKFYKNFMLHYNFPPYCVGEGGAFAGARATRDWSWGAGRARAAPGAAAA
ncbi:MAG: hypothetical protein KatS3mg131_2865 [Candidatus Tectimicrobiota bacterium]|nr:MAG: hypothetical protein KatS3mg131_2865 [Candidatus Tectomicrobia bacterium]